MRFLVTLLIPSLFVDKADSEFSFIPRQNLYPCASYSPGVRSQKYSPPPLPSIPLASYHSPFSFDHGIKQNRKTHIGFRGNQARTDDLHRVKRVFHEEDLDQHVLFDTGRRRTRLGIFTKIEKSEPSQDDTDQPLFLRSCAKNLTISEVTGVTSIFPFQFKSSYVFPRPFETPKNGQIPFLRNTYKIRHHKKRIMRLTSLLLSCYNPLAAELPFSSAHRDKMSSKGSRRPTKARKPGSFRK
ncbi:hypothetical protein Lal_00045180 [Lupinus albus]|nr:hypothetical protein Lal_00045180 [Lupinus albus]